MRSINKSLYAIRRGLVIACKNPIIRYFSTKNNKSILFLSLSHLPEPQASAAGVRTNSLLHHFLTSPNYPKQVNYATGRSIPQTLNESTNDLIKLGLKINQLPPNRKIEMQTFWNETIRDTKVEMVIFDRFYSEEAYSYNVHNYSPDTIKVLDMQDMHSLRLARQEFISKWDNDPINTTMMTNECMKKVMSCLPTINDTILLRELASIHRCDLVLVCSPYEKHILETKYKIPKEKLILSPFYSEIQHVKKNHDKNKFVFVGGFKHNPNKDAVYYLYKELWPNISSQIPNATMNIYGAYSDGLRKELHNPKGNFYLHGFAPTLDIVFNDASLLLCPLRYGAGIKGKIVDAWMHGIPVVCTPIAAEGMFPTDCKTSNGQDITNWGGLIASNTEEFTQSALKLHNNKSQWDKCSKRGEELIKLLYDKEHNLNVLDDAIEDIRSNVNKRREDDYVRSILWHQSNRSTEYFSKWIEVKETKLK